MNDGHTEPRPQRFDPIFATWTSPDGLLPDPARPGGAPAEPATVVGAVPPELAEATGAQADDPRGLSWAQRARWSALAVVSLWVGAIVGAFHLARHWSATSATDGVSGWLAWLVIGMCLSLAGLSIQRLRAGRS